jgi:hypothetical protein
MTYGNRSLGVKYGKPFDRSLFPLAIECVFDELLARESTCLRDEQLASGATRIIILHQRAAG